MLKILVPATTQPIHMFGTGEWDSEVDSMGALSEAKTRERERVRALAALEGNRSTEAHHGKLPEGHGSKSSGTYAKPC